MKLRMNGQNHSGKSFAKGNLRESDLSNASFDNADFTEASLDSCDMRNSTFRGACLNRASFKGADLKTADFTKADITKTNFRGADLQGVRGLIRVEWKGLTHYIQKDKIRIDCMTRTVREWIDAPDEELWALIKKHNIQATPDEHRAIWKLAELLTGE